MIHLLLANRDNGPGHVGPRPAEHWDELVARFPANILPRMLDGVTLAVPRPRRWPTTSPTFVRAHPLPIGQRTVDQTLERLAGQRGVRRLAGTRRTARPRRLVTSLTGA